MTNYGWVMDYSANLFDIVNLKDDLGEYRIARKTVNTPEVLGFPTLYLVPVYVNSKNWKWVQAPLAKIYKENVSGLPGLKVQIPVSKNGSPSEVNIFLWRRDGRLWASNNPELEQDISLSFEAGELFGDRTPWVSMFENGLIKSIYADSYISPALCPIIS